MTRWVALCVGSRVSTMGWLAIASWLDNSTIFSATQWYDVVFRFETWLIFQVQYIRNFHHSFQIHTPFVSASTDRHPHSSCVNPHVCFPKSPCFVSESQHFFMMGAHSRFLPPQWWLQARRCPSVAWSPASSHQLGAQFHRWVHGR